MKAKYANFLDVDLFVALRQPSGTKKSTEVVRDKDSFRIIIRAWA
jgi:hypothetical protein